MNALAPALRAKLEGLPKSPGVYVFLDAVGRVLYVGKAADLRSRVRSYFSDSDDGRARVPLIRRDCRDLDVLHTRTTLEALVLENTLIKKHKPRYNVQLRDDKAYIRLRVDTAHRFPRIHVVRRFKKDGAKYFGPYASSRAVRETLKQIQQTFGLRVCSDHTLENRDRPCLFHQLGRCSAPCVDKIDEELYGETVNGALDLIRGRRRDVIEDLRVKMTDASERLEFERAAMLRDRIAGIERTSERQAVMATDLGDRDVVGLHREGEDVLVARLFVREGTVVSARTHFLRSVETDDEVMAAVLLQCYGRGRWVPPEILVPTEPRDRELIEEALSDVREGAVHVRVPRRGPKREVLALAHRNAVEAMEERRRGHAEEMAALKEIERRLGLSRTPLRIECFDVSTFQGVDSVASMVTFLDGRADKDGYRRFQVKSVEGTDDFASMAEVLGRRFRDGVRSDPPDLIVIDGGKGQLGAARGVLEELGLGACDVVGLAKARAGRPGVQRYERVFKRDEAQPIAFDPVDPTGRLLARIRDEAHRFAITYHRKKRAARTLGSPLNRVKGIGAKRRRALLDAFGGLEGLRRASVEDLTTLPGITLTMAKEILANLGVGAGDG